MAPKRKAVGKAAEEPAKKEAKTGESKEAPKKEEPKAAEPKEAEPKAAGAEEAAPAEPDTTEKETNAAADKRVVLKEPVAFRNGDLTLNAVPTLGGRVLRCLTDGGMQFLIAGARAGTGLKAGRYMFEVKILETLSVSEQQWQRNAPKPKQLVRIGFSMAGSSLVLGSGEGGIGFDNEGLLMADGKMSYTGHKFFKEQTVAVLLNLDSKSPNANTISLFRNGERLTQPHPVPASLQGKTLFPHISFRNVSVQVNFGAEPLAPLPFTCRMLGAAAQADTESAPSHEPKDGKFEVLLPVCFPDEGSFDWLDGFLSKNPQYTELSDRKIIEWAVASGLHRRREYGKQGSNDKPQFDFGLPPLEDFSVRNVLQAFAPVMPRHYVVMEVRNNLLPAEREKVLKRFGTPSFKKTACVIMGEPPKEFKADQHEKLRIAKQEKAEQAWMAKKAELARKKAANERAKQIANQRKEAEERRKKMVDEAKKRLLEDEAKKAEEGDAETKPEGDAEKKDEEAKEEGKEEAKEEAKDEAKEEPKAMEVDAEGAQKGEEKAEDAAEDEEMGESAPPVELTDEDKKLWFAPKAVPDVNETAFSLAFCDFSIPEKSEGFDAIRFEWQKEAPAKEYLRVKVLDKKRTSRIETLQPSQWFQEKWANFKKLFAEWQKKQDALAKNTKKAGKEEEDEEQRVLAGDIFSIEDVCDVQGEPLFKDFELADWALLQLRFELWLLQAAFTKDVNDPDRPAIPSAHVAFYYQKYYKKTFAPKAFGAEDCFELVKMVKDTMAWEEDLLRTVLTIEDDDPSVFVKHAEEARRERQRRIDAGDETARLKVQPVALTGYSGGGRRGDSWGSKRAGGPLRPPLAPPAPLPTIVTPPSAKGGGKKGGSWGSSSWSGGGGWRSGSKGGKGRW